MIDYRIGAGFVGRAAFLWGGVRASSFLVGRLTPPKPYANAVGTTGPSVVESAVVLAIVLTLLLIDMRALRERVFLHQLSTGERRRAEIALACARAPACLLADELFLGIAPRDAETIAVSLREQAANGAGILVTGHEIGWLVDVADEIVWMTAGTTHVLGSPADAIRNDQFRREYLGMAARMRGQA